MGKSGDRPSTVGGSPWTPCWIVANSAVLSEAELAPFSNRFHGAVSGQSIPYNAVPARAYRLSGAFDPGFRRLSSAAPQPLGYRCCVSGLWRHCHRLVRRTGVGNAGRAQKPLRQRRRREWLNIFVNDPVTVRVEPVVGGSASTGLEDVVARLARLKRLADTGTITPDEHVVLRRSVLDAINEWRSGEYLP